jgi:hypothetical protein
MDTSSLGAEALQKLKATFAPERWAKIERQAARLGMDAEALQARCLRLLTSSTARHAANEKAALYSAANRLLLEVGSALKPEDIERFEEALGGVTTRRDDASKGDDSSPLPKKRGGKHDPAPVSQ